MTNEQLIEAEAEYSWTQNGNAFQEWRTVSEHDKQIWRRIALAHFHQLNEWGVRMQAENQSFAPFAGIPVDFYRVVPLPEAKE